MKSFQCIANIPFDGTDIENGLFSYLGHTAYDPDEVGTRAFPGVTRTSDPLSALIGVKQPIASISTVAEYRECGYTFHLKKLYFHPTHYAVKNDLSGDSSWNRRWILEGSNDDGASFETLHEVLDTEYAADRFQGRGKILHFAVNLKKSKQSESLKYYQLFRLRSTDPLNQFTLSGFELWGKCGIPTNTFRRKRRPNAFSKILNEQLLVFGYIRRVHQEYGLNIEHDVEQCIMSIFGKMNDDIHCRRLSITKLWMDGTFGSHSKIALQSFLCLNGGLDQIVNGAVDGQFGSFSNRSLHRFLISVGYDLKEERFGEWGTETTKMLQRFLKGEGFGNMYVDGLFGSETTMHLQAFLNSLIGEPAIEPVCFSKRIAIK